MSRSMRESVTSSLVASVLILCPSSLFSANSTIAGFTQLGHTDYDLNVLVFWVCVAVAHVLFGLMIFSIATARVEQEIQFRNSAKVEVAWTIIPILIFIGVAIPSGQELIGSAENASSVGAVVMGDRSIGDDSLQDIVF